jgi:hypothetical protein
MAEASLGGAGGSGPGAAPRKRARVEQPAPGAGRPLACGGVAVGHRAGDAADEVCCRWFLRRAPGDRTPALGRNALPAGWHCAELHSSLANPARPPASRTRRAAATRAARRCSSAPRRPPPPRGMGTAAPAEGRSSRGRRPRPRGRSGVRAGPPEGLRRAAQAPAVAVAARSMIQRAARMRPGLTATRNRPRAAAAAAAAQTATKRTTAAAAPAAAAAAARAAALDRCGSAPMDGRSSRER